MLNPIQWALKPAVKDYQIDKNLLTERVVAMVLTSCIFTTLTFINAAIQKNRWSFCLCLIVSPLTFLLTIALGKLDKVRAETFADNAAVGAFRLSQYPSPHASNRIANSLPAAQKLIQNYPSAIHQIDENGTSLVQMANSDVFKLLIENGAKVTPDQLTSIVGHQNSIFLKIFLEIKPRIVDSLTHDQQVDLWYSCGTREAVKLLKQYSFNPNIRNKDGYTPLMKLAAEKYFREYSIESPYKITLHQHITALLECGADPSLTLEVKGKVYQASDLTKNPLMKKLLEEKISLT